MVALLDIIRKKFLHIANADESFKRLQLLRLHQFKGAQSDISPLYRPISRKQYIDLGYPTF